MTAGKRWTIRVLAGVGAVALIGAMAFWWHVRHATASGPMLQEYVIEPWQWRGDLTSALSQASNANELVIVAATVSFAGREPMVNRPDIDWPLLGRQSKKLGILIRVDEGDSPTSDANSSNSYGPHVLAAISNKALADANSAGAVVSEVQIDCTGAAGYNPAPPSWIAAIQNACSTPVLVWVHPTADEDFTIAAKASNGVIVELPENGAKDTSQFVENLQKLAGAGRPMRLAISTGSVVTAVDASGRSLGEWRNGLRPPWPKSTTASVGRIDRQRISDVLTQLRAGRSALLTSVVWDRLPDVQDVLALNGASLNAIVAGEPLHAAMHVVLRPVETKLTEIDLANDGNDYSDGIPDVQVIWSGASLVDARGLSGFTRTDVANGNVIFHAPSPAGSELLPLGIPPGDKTAVGWVRLSSDVTVNATLMASGASTQPTTVP